jgi:hypothetical protein
LIHPLHPSRLFSCVVVIVVISRILGVNFGRITRTLLCRIQFALKKKKLTTAPCCTSPLRTTRSHTFDLVSRCTFLPSRSSLTLCPSKLTAYWLHYATSYPITHFRQLLYTTSCYQWRLKLGLQPPRPSSCSPSFLDTLKPNKLGPKIYVTRTCEPPLIHSA